MPSYKYAILILLDVVKCLTLQHVYLEVKNRRTDNNTITTRKGESDEK